MMRMTTAALILLAAATCCSGPPPDVEQRVVTAAGRVARDFGWRFENDTRFPGLFIATADIGGEPVRLAGRVGRVRGRWMLATCHKSSGLVVEQAVAAQERFYAALSEGLPMAYRVPMARSMDDIRGVFGEALEACLGPQASAESRQGFEGLSDDGVVLVPPGQQPVVIAGHESRQLSALGGALRFVHSFEDRVPTPAVGRFVRVTSAGPAFPGGAEGIEMQWVVTLAPARDDLTLGGISRVKVEDVTDAQAVTLIDTVPDVHDDSALVVGRRLMVSRATAPWVYTADETQIVFRITVSGESSEVLLQPVVFDAAAKQQLRRSLALR